MIISSTVAKLQPNLLGMEVPYVPFSGIVPFGHLELWIELVTQSTPTED